MTTTTTTRVIVHWTMRTAIVASMWGFAIVTEQISHDAPEHRCWLTERSAENGVEVVVPLPGDHVAEGESLANRGVLGNDLRVATVCN